MTEKMFASSGQEIINRHKYYWSQKDFWESIILGLLFLAGSLVFNHFASVYVDKNAGAYVQDILLDNLPVMNVDWIINDGVMVFSFLVTVYALMHPKKMPFFLKSLALFILIRSVFISLTHLGPAPSRTYMDPNDLLLRINAGRDMFFSGHTGLPFLLALMFWENKIMRYVSLLASVVFGCAVLLGHMHYSIDVFGALFITYTIFHIAQKLFTKDFKLFNEKSAEVS
jgi:membrane-associated phospholipid phosphatase